MSLDNRKFEHIRPFHVHISRFRPTFQKIEKFAIFIDFWTPFCVDFWRMSYLPNPRASLAKYSNRLGFRA